MGKAPVTALDTRYPELDRFLHGVRRQLNLRLIAGTAVKVALAAGGVGAAALIWMPPALPRATLWWGATLGAAATGAVVRWWRRLSKAQVASWLDEGLKTGGVYRAAVDALDRDAEVFPDALILRDANRRRDRPLYPWRRLTVLGFSGLGLVSVALAALTFVVPGFGPNLRNPEVSTPSASRPGDPSLPPAGKEPLLSPRDAGKRLFPEDQRLAALAEQALTSGDAGALEALLSQNPGTPSSDSPNPSSGQKGPSRGGGLDRGAPGSSLGEGWTPGGAQGTPGTQGKPGTQPRPGDSQPGASKNPGANQGPGSGSGGLSAPGNQGSGPPSEPPGFSRPGTGGGAPGDSHSDQKFQGRPGSPNDKKVMIQEKPNPGVFESVLPESGAKLPTAGVLAETRRSVEAALHRDSAPQEFENAVRDYFLSLSEEAKP